MYFAILILCNIVKSDWVEISPIVNRSNQSVISYGKSTTPSPSPEVVMRTPVSKPYVTTTPALDVLKEETVINEDYNFDIPEVFHSSSLSASDDDDENVTANDENVTFNGFFSFLNMAQKNLLKLTARESKITVLKNLRNSLLTNLNTSIANLWKTKSNKEAKGYKDDHEMEFPSNEGALMTIGFLTFAVFLIKLVIKLVEALKYKLMFYGPTTTTTAATVLFLKRKKREEEFNEETSRVLNYLETYPDFDLS